MSHLGNHSLLSLVERSNRDVIRTKIQIGGRFPDVQFDKPYFLPLRYPDSTGKSSPSIFSPNFSIHSYCIWRCNHRDVAQLLDGVGGDPDHHGPVVLDAGPLVILGVAKVLGDVAHGGRLSSRAGDGGRRGP